MAERSNDVAPDLVPAGGRGTLWFIASVDDPVLLSELCGGRGTECAAGAELARFPAEPETSLPLAVCPALGRVEAGELIRLTVGRDDVEAGGRAILPLARAPSMLARVGLASIRPRADAPWSWLEETFTEFPRTGKPRSSEVRDIAVMAPGWLANCGILPPAPPHIGVLPPLWK